MLLKHGFRAIKIAPESSVNERGELNWLHNMKIGRIPLFHSALKWKVLPPCPILGCHPNEPCSYNEAFGEKRPGGVGVAGRAGWDLWGPPQATSGAQLGSSFRKQSPGARAALGALKPGMFSVVLSRRGNLGSDVILI